MVSYDDKNYRVKVSPSYSNPHIPELWHAGYTLKVLNSMDSKKNHVGQCTFLQREIQDFFTDRRLTFAMNWKGHRFGLRVASEILVIHWDSGVSVVYFKIFKQ